MRNNHFVIKLLIYHGLFTPCCRGGKIIPVREDKDISEIFSINVKYLASCESSITALVRDE
nr:MAG TPA: hypothetical protein [Caudoviricetes sp.]